jgi:hypothetical protein
VSVHDIAGGNVRIEKVRNQMSLTQASMAGGAVVLSGVSMMASPTGGAGFAYFLKLINTVEYLIMMNGVKVKFSDRYLDNFKNDPLKLVVNYFSVDEDKIKCRPTENFDIEGVSCYLLNEVGSDLSIVIGLALLVPLFYLINILMAKLLKAQYLKTHKVLVILLFVPSHLFRLRILVMILEAQHMEFFRVSFLNIFNGVPSIYMGIGLGVSILLILFYVGFSYLMIKYIHMRIIKGEQKIEGKLQHFELIFDEFPKVLSKKHYNYLPLISMIKDCLSQLLLVLLGGKGMAQLWVLVVLETVGVWIGVLYFKAMIGWKRYIQIVQSVTYLIIVSIYILVNYADFEEFDREVYVGWTLCVFYTIILGTAVSTMIVDPVVAIWTMIKTRRSQSSVVPKEAEAQQPAIQEDQPSRMMNRHMTPMKVKTVKDIEDEESERRPSHRQSIGLLKDQVS